MRLNRFALLLALAALLSGCGGAGPAGKPVKQYGGVRTRPDAVAERSIVLLHPHSGERLALTYYHDGGYDPKAMAAINRLFRDRHAGAVGAIDPELVDFLVDIRTRLGLPPPVTFEILNGYRTEETNAMLARRDGQVAKESLHRHGWAVDFRMPGVHGGAIAEIARTMQRGGVSFYPRDNHVHVDLGNIRTWTTK
jgi:uncharacterized protein YcbK (DUF882 family)